MNEVEYISLRDSLLKIASTIPRNWGRIQNDNTDSKINMFKLNDYSSLLRAIENCSPETKQYFKRRWFLWKCAQCDEYLFYRNADINKNTNPYDQKWDIEFFGNPNLRFDIKSTTIPREIKNKIGDVFPTNHKEIIKFNYDNQSKGVRNFFQNRLFIVHIPMIDIYENTLRARFEEKKSIIEMYIQQIKSKENYIFYEYNGCKSDIIYIDSNCSYLFASTELNR